MKILRRLLPNERLFNYVPEVVDFIASLPDYPCYGLLAAQDIQRAVTTKPA
jgi:hypothetical protein